MPLRTRIINVVFVAVIILLTGYGTWVWRGARGDMGDLFFPVCAARNWFVPEVYYGLCEIGEDPDGRRYPLNPLTTAIIVWPLGLLPDHVVALAFMAVSVGLLAWGIMRTGEPWRLLIFISAPLWLCVHWTQWTHLLLAAWYLPWLWPIVLLAKPHAAIPIVLLRWRDWPVGISIVATVVLVSLGFNPRWPFDFLSSISGYSGGPALLTWYGPFVALALFRWRDERARLLLLAALVPLRGLYDLIILFAIPRDRWSMAALVSVSWIAALAINLRPDPGSLSTAVVWLTALVLVFIPVTIPSPELAPIPQREEA